MNGTRWGMDPEDKQIKEDPDSQGRIRFVFNVPNALTLIRLFAIAPLAVLLSRWPEHRIATLILFLLIWATDFLDGYIARRFNLMTEFGKLFDPFVDKVFQVVTAFMLYSVGLTPVWVPLYYAARESFMLFGSTLLLTKRHIVVFSDRLGKVATFLFVLATVVMFFGGSTTGWLRQFIFIPAVLCSFFATLHYISQQARLGKKKDDQEENTQDA